MLYDIILPLAISDVYTYNIPSEGCQLLDASLSDARQASYGTAAPIGCRVLVPLGKKSVIGIIYRRHEGELAPNIKVRDIQ